MSNTTTLINQTAAKSAFRRVSKADIKKRRTKKIQKLKENQGQVRAPKNTRELGDNGPESDEEEQSLGKNIYNDEFSSQFSDQLAYFEGRILKNSSRRHNHYNSLKKRVDSYFHARMRNLNTLMKRVTNEEGF